MAVPCAQAIVVSRPEEDRTGDEPVFMRTKEPVPYVFFEAPGSKQACPNSAAC